MGPQCVFGEAVQTLSQVEIDTPEGTQALQTIHHLMTGGPAESPDAAKAKIHELCETVMGFVAPPKATRAERKAAEHDEHEEKAEHHVEKPAEHRGR